VVANRCEKAEVFELKPTTVSRLKWSRMSKPLSTEELNLLRAINTPTIANAIEVLGLRQRSEGFTDSSIRCIFPDLGVTVGYAVTATIRSGTPPDKSPGASLKTYWDHIANFPAPRVVVVHEIDQPAAGAWWGEINSNIHRALGCIGLVTDGVVRDLDEVRPLGFQFFATGVAVSHVYAHLDDFNKPVTVGGMAVRPGDLIHADKHGAIVIPVQHARQMLEAAMAVERYERPMIRLCKSSEFSTEKLDQLMKSKIV
jgi:regulator of RNase E activity RraA